MEGKLNLPINAITRQVIDCQLRELKGSSLPAGHQPPYLCLQSELERYSRHSSSEICTQWHYNFIINRKMLWSHTPDFIFDWDDLISSYHVFLEQVPYITLPFSGNLHLQKQKKC